MDSPADLSQSIRSVGSVARNKTLERVNGRPEANRTNGQKSRLRKLFAYLLTCEMVNVVCTILLHRMYDRYRFSEYAVASKQLDKLII